jgi:D-cysteine desulfhydrase
LIERRFIGGAYKQPSAEGPASQEGILLDPIYTAKAFTGLLDLASRGQTAGDEPRIYLHTDGLPALFAREDGSLEHA